MYLRFQLIDTLQSGRSFMCNILLCAETIRAAWEHRNICTSTTLLSDHFMFPKALPLPSIRHDFTAREGPFLRPLLQPCGFAQVLKIIGPGSAWAGHMVSQTAGGSRVSPAQVSMAPTHTHWPAPRLTDWRRVSVVVSRKASGLRSTILEEGSLQNQSAAHLPQLQAG